MLKLYSAGTRKLGNKGIFIILVIIFISSIWKNSITIFLRFKIWWVTEWLSNIKLAIFSYITTRAGFFTLRWWWCSFCTRPISLIDFFGSRWQPSCSHTKSQLLHFLQNPLLIWCGFIYFCDKVIHNGMKNLYMDF